MRFNESPLVKIAVLDLNDGFENQGMRGIRDIIKRFDPGNRVQMQFDVFDVRQKLEVPNIDYDIYISSGGPGSPIDSEGEAWDNLYFEWLSAMEAWNNSEGHLQKKSIFFICHSFQLACRHFKIGNLCERNSNSFGVFPIHMLEDGIEEPVFSNLQNPFYAVDSRDYQVIQPNYEQIEKLGARILAIEKERVHVPLERAMMAIRFTDHFIGTQFHPEADAVGMIKHLLNPEKKALIIKNHGEAKWHSMLDRLNDPDKILWTQARVLPNFLNYALARMLTVSAA